MTTITDTDWFPNLRNCIEDGVIRTFGTQRAAEEVAMEFGWGKRILRVERKHERVYIVGVLDFQPDVEGGIEFQPLRIPLLRYDTGDDGIKFQPVVKFRKPYGG